jgi:hypothetical protein
MAVAVGKPRKEISLLPPPFDREPIFQKVFQKCRLGSVPVSCLIGWLVKSLLSYAGGVGWLVGWLVKSLLSYAGGGFHGASIKMVVAFMVNLTLPLI